MNQSTQLKHRYFNHIHTMFQLKACKMTSYDSIRHQHYVQLIEVAPLRLVK